jgi:adenylate kinase
MRILFLGPPGSGKGTQCKKLADKLKIVHLSSGDLLRAVVAAGSPAGLAAKKFMDAGNLVPDDVLIAMFGEKLASPESAPGFILDGFPRNLKQAESLDKLLAELKTPLDVVFNLQIADDLLSKRITGRRSCPKCGAVYHVKFHPPKQDNICDACGGTLAQRSDDKAELVTARLDTYRKQTAPLIEYYDEQSKLQTIAADGEPDDIFEKILADVKVLENSHSE